MSRRQIYHGYPPCFNLNKKVETKVATKLVTKELRCLVKITVWELNKLFKVLPCKIKWKRTIVNKWDLIR